MRKFTQLPTLNVEFLKPRRFVVDIAGNAVDGARNGAGHSISMELSGGGSLVASVEECFVHMPQEHEYHNWLSAELNGSFRFINVPICTDWMGPFPKINGMKRSFIGGIPHSDGALHSDGAGYRQATVTGEITAAAGLNAGIVTMRLDGLAENLWLSGWFSIEHPVKGHRAYRYRQVMSGSLSNPTYTLALEVPLREAVAAGTKVRWADPLCVMKFETGFRAPWSREGFQLSTPSYKFVEAF